MQLVKNSDAELEQEAWNAKKDGVKSYVRYATAIARLLDNGRHTQQSLADMFDDSREGIAQAAMVGRDKRIVNAVNKLPPSESTLYQLSTLDDSGFKELANPTTKRSDVEAYKRRLAAPKSTTITTPNKIEPIRPTVEQVRASTLYHPDPEETPRGSTTKSIRVDGWTDFVRDWDCTGFDRPIKDVRSKADAYYFLGLPKGLRKEIYQIVYKGLASKYQPRIDGADRTLMTQLNAAKEMIDELNS